MRRTPMQVWDDFLFDLSDSVAVLAILAFIVAPVTALLVLAFSIWA